MSRHPSSVAVLAAGLVMLTLVGFGAAPAAADGIKIIVGGSAGWGAPWGRHDRQAGPGAPAKVIVTDPRTKVIVTDPGTRVIVAPRAYYYAPSYTLPPAPRWVPGYWVYQWVPQLSTSYVYVPGYYTSQGDWVESHYEPRLTQTSSYQPVWVGGYWAR